MQSLGFPIGRSTGLICHASSPNLSIDVDVAHLANQMESHGLVFFAMCHVLSALKVGHFAAPTRGRFLDLPKRKGISNSIIQRHTMCSPAIISSVAWQDSICVLVGNVIPATTNASLLTLN
jgi:hypothetical protein